MLISLAAWGRGRTAKRGVMTTTATSCRTIPNRATTPPTHRTAGLSPTAASVTCAITYLSEYTVNSRYLEVVGTIFYKFKLPEVQINLHFG